MCTCRRRRTCRLAFIEKLIEAGIDDWGGVSPVTPDHVNPEAPWPEIEALAQRTAAMGKVLVPRLPVYPAYAFEADRWCAPGIATRVRRAIDAEGWAREDDWAPGLTVLPHRRAPLLDRVDPAVDRLSVAKAVSGARLDETEIVRLFAARDADYEHVITAADALRQAVSGDDVRYVVNRNINYTNICYYRCKFCAFSKGKTHEALARHAVRPGARRNRAPLARGVGSRRDRSVPARRHPSRLHRRDLCRHLPRDQGGVARRCTSTRSRRWR